MQLDQARIAICERTWADNLDLALHVVRTYGGPLAICALVTIVPLAVANYFLLTWMFPDPTGDEAFPGIFYWMVCLVLIEAPLATAPATLYLGQALFVEKPSARMVARDFFSCLPQLVLLQGLLRVILILPVITWFIPYTMWPYLNEVILLERNPLVGRRGQISTLKRSSLLHRGNNGEYLLRAILSGLLALLLVVAISWTEVILVRNLFGFETGPTLGIFEIQAALWLVAVFFAVARFLTYLDGRIRNEGWEVELLLRAQQSRLTRQIA